MNLSTRGSLELLSQQYKFLERIGERKKLVIFNFPITFEKRILRILNDHYLYIPIKWNHIRTVSFDVPKY